LRLTSCQSKKREVSAVERAATCGDYQKDNRMHGRDKSSLRFVSMESTRIIFSILGAGAACGYDLSRTKQLPML
jgi:hypothetical protein